MAVDLAASITSFAMAVLLLLLGKSAGFNDSKTFDADSAADVNPDWAVSNGVSQKVGAGWTVATGKQA